MILLVTFNMVFTLILADFLSLTDFPPSAWLFINDLPFNLFDLGNFLEIVPSTVTCIRHENVFMTGCVCTCDNGGDSIYTKAISVWAQFAANSDLFPPSSEVDGNTISSTSGAE